ncbi:hypothetical protein HPB52_004190 [Rhipicephalus sanguineus]|uniref:Uracil-DNA glycosylase-like domain-containing protein n=1 Tax=Rhipicephalus sanguineus TaxID=34632 RepID=A0A9D4QH13_RHISA|nr:hypothetical protein HPB52_004190 [Rhipicephalus sanguineus]
MPGQKQISAFFKPLATSSPKRLLSSENSVCHEQPMKKPKSEGSPENNAFSPAIDIEKKRLIAKVKLQSRATPIVPPDIGLSWFGALEQEFSKEYFLKLDGGVHRRLCCFWMVGNPSWNTYYHPASHLVLPGLHNMPSLQTILNDIMTSLRWCNVVIVAGIRGTVVFLCVTQYSPPSLLNMYKELANDIPGFQQPSHGNLTGWAQQGVLLLNACLTVRMNTPNSHKDRGWENLTDAVIRHLNKQCSNLVFLLWGAYAQKKGSIIDRVCFPKAIAC